MGTNQTVVAKVALAVSAYNGVAGAGIAMACANWRRVIAMPTEGTHAEVELKALKCALINLKDGATAEVYASRYVASLWNGTAKAHTNQELLAECRKAGEGKTVHAKVRVDSMPIAKRAKQESRKAIGLESTHTEKYEVSAK